MWTPAWSAQLKNVAPDCLGRRLRTQLRAGMRSRGCGDLTVHNRTPLPTGDPWQLSHGLRVFQVERPQQAGVGEV